MKEEKKENKNQENKKQDQLEQFKVDDKGKTLTTNTGMKVTEDEKSLTAGKRGPVGTIRKNDNLWHDSE